MLARDQLQRAAADSGFPVDSVEKVWMLIRILNMMVAHPFMGSRVALKGGTALNLFMFEVPRLSVDIDLNYIGASDRATTTAERPKIDAALQQVVSRIGLMVKRTPGEHAGGKWRLSYTSVLGRPSVLEVDVNYMFRVPLWDPEICDSREFLGDRVKRIQVVEKHELAAGKLAALLARGASRDLFDARQLLASATLDRNMLRLAFVVYGGNNRVDWRAVSTESVTTTVDDVRRQLLPMLRHDIRPAANDVERWTDDLIGETRALLRAVLPLAEHELAFLDLLNGQGEIEPSLLTSDAELQRRIAENPGMRWKALNVKQHGGG